MQGERSVPYSVPLSPDHLPSDPVASVPSSPRLDSPETSIPDPTPPTPDMLASTGAAVADGLGSPITAPPRRRNIQELLVVQSLLEDEREAHNLTQTQLSRALATQCGVDGQAITEVAYQLACGEIETTDAVQLLLEEVEKARCWAYGGSGEREGGAVGPEKRLDEVEVSLRALAARIEVVEAVVFGDAGPHTGVIAALTSGQERTGNVKGKGLFKSPLERLAEVEAGYVQCEAKVGMVEAMQEQVDGWDEEWEELFGQEASGSDQTSGH